MMIPLIWSKKEVYVALTLVIPIHQSLGETLLRSKDQVRFHQDNPTARSDDSKQLLDSIGPFRHLPVRSVDSRSPICQFSEGGSPYLYTGHQIPHVDHIKGVILVRQGFEYVADLEGYIR